MLQVPPDKSFSTANIFRNLSGVVFPLKLSFSSLRTASRKNPTVPFNGYFLCIEKPHDILHERLSSPDSPRF